MKNDIFSSIKDLLNKHSIPFKTVHHKPTYTSEESAKARGEDISIGGKAIVLKINKSYKLFVLSASQKIDSASIKRYFDIKKIRFATPEELKKITGLIPGAVPPFGEPILPLQLFVDNSILNNKKIAFNAGSLTDSIIMKVDDYIKMTKPKIFSFTNLSKTS